MTFLTNIYFNKKNEWRCNLAAVAVYVASTTPVSS